MKWNKFLKTLGRMYSILYGLLFCLWIVAIMSGADMHALRLGTSDMIFALWAIGSALWNAAE